MHLAVVSLAIFFGFIGISLIILLIIWKIAEKYLSGDYVKVTHEDEEELTQYPTDEVEVNTYPTDKEIQEEDGVGNDTVIVDLETGTEECKPKKKRKLFLSRKVNAPEDGEAPLPKSPEVPERTKQPTSETGIEDPSQEKYGEVCPRYSVYDGGFGINSVISISMNYMKKDKKLVGAITAIQYLGKGPEHIRFHLKFLPVRKPIVKTHWESAKSSRFTLSFVLNHAKVKPPLNDKSLLSVRLYGKHKKAGMSRVKCYAECFIPWTIIADADGPLNLEQRLHRKGAEEETEHQSEDLLSSTDDALSD